MFKRFVLKLSGEAIGKQRVLKSSGEPDGAKDEKIVYGYDDELIDLVVSQINTCLQAGNEISLVVGGGNYWRGLSARPDMNRVKADHVGMLATVMNALYLEEAFKRGNRNAVTLTPFAFGNFTEQYEKNKALRYLESGCVVISAAGLGHPFFTTDTVTALRAAELEADCVLFAKNKVDGVYNSNPSINKSAKKYKSLSYKTFIETDLRVADHAAIQLLNDEKIPAFAFSMLEKNAIIDAVNYPQTNNLNGTFLSSSEQDILYV